MPVERIKHNSRSREKTGVWAQFYWLQRAKIAGDVDFRRKHKAP